MQFSSSFFHFFIFFLSFLLLVVELMKNDEKWWKMIKKDKKMKKKWKKKLEENCNFPKNEKLQFSSSFFFIFFSFVYHFSSFLLPVVQKLSEKWKNTIFLEFFSCFIIFFIIFLSFVYHFLSFFIIFHHFLSFFINSTTGSKNDKNMIKKWKKTRGKLQFSIFWIFFCTTGRKND